VGGEALEQVCQRSCGGLLPGSVQGQAGWGFELPGLVDGAPTYWQRDWNSVFCKVPSNSNHSMILSFYEVFSKIVLSINYVSLDSSPF